MLRKIKISLQEATMGISSSAPFSYELDISGDTTTITCHGRVVTETAPELKELVKPMIPKCRRIVLDFTDVHLVDSSGLGNLVGLKISAASAAYCSLELHNLSPHVKALFGLTKLYQVLGT
jgi:anti-sigma B factor antagonist